MTRDDLVAAVPTDLRSKLLIEGSKVWRKVRGSTTAHCLLTFLFQFDLVAEMSKRNSLA